MKKEIIKQIKKIEETEKVRIIMAVEAGSRAWGFEGTDSDYDVRFIYVRPLKEYLRLDKTRDVLEFPIEGELDFSGWDISKTLKLIYSSNPALHEWLQSPIVYRKTAEVKELEKLARKHFSRTRIVNHYYHIAFRHYQRFVAIKEKVRLKKYFYILRSLAAALYAVRKDDIPPIELDVLRSSEFPWEMNVIIDEMVRIKKENDESRQIERIVELDIFIENMLKEINDNIQQFQQTEAASWQDLNRFFRKVVKNK